MSKIKKKSFFPFSRLELSYTWVILYSTDALTYEEILIPCHNNPNCCDWATAMGGLLSNTSWQTLSLPQYVWQVRAKTRECKVHFGCN